MVNRARIMLASAPLRAALAVLFLILSSVQPALFAAGVNGFQGGKASASTMEPHDGGEAHRHDAHHETAQIDLADVEENCQNHHGVNGNDKSCEVHCAPGQAVPVECPIIEPVFASCFVSRVTDGLPRGEYTVHIRPPKHLV